jgi:hypothetical protein
VDDNVQAIVDIFRDNPTLLWSAVGIVGVAVVWLLGRSMRF